MRRLKTIAIKNFKSIRDQRLELGRLNVFIGGNGSGKSNFIEVFRFLRELADENLGGYTLRKGGADSLLYRGRSTSREMQVEVMFYDNAYGNGYRVTLFGTDDDTLVVKEETATFHDTARYNQPYDEHLAVNVREATLRKSRNKVAAYVRRDLESYRVYHFHDTSDTAKARGYAQLTDNRFLSAQAENLAAFLYWLDQREHDRFTLIQDTIRQIAPFFDRFELAPDQLNPQRILLEWRERGSDAYFNANALSDGTLRFICLATLLLQPKLPAVVLLDEPELGLHPAAITLLADLLSSAAERTQVIVATQSVTLVNRFGPEDVWTAERVDGASVFRHLSEADISGWIEDYALGDLWEKNVIGARP